VNILLNKSRANILYYTKFELIEIDLYFQDHTGSYRYSTVNVHDDIISDVLARLPEYSYTVIR